MRADCCRVSHHCVKKKKLLCSSSLKSGEQRKLVTQNGQAHFSLCTKYYTVPINKSER